MKVAMVTAGLSQRGGGIAAVVEGLSMHIEQQGIACRVFGPADTTWIREGQQNWKGAQPLAFRVVGPAKLAFMPRMKGKLIDWNPDVTHSHGLWMHTSRTALNWSRRTRRPTIVSIHGMLAPAALHFSPLKKRLSRLLYEDAALAAAKAIHATCLQEYEEIRAFGLKQPIAIVPNGIEVPNVERPSPDADEKVVVSLGRIHPKKGLDRLIQAWSVIEPLHPTWFLKIVGPDEKGHVGELKRLANTLGLRRVTFSGPVWGEKKWKLLAGADLFVLPSLNENFAMTVAESLACGTPVISTKGAPWKDLETKRCGWWIEHGPESIAAALDVAMLLPVKERCAMGARGRAWMELNFSWPSVATRMRDVYGWLAGLNDCPESVILN